MKGNCKTIFILFLFFSAIWISPLYGATTEEQYVGEWTGDVYVTGEDNENVSIIILLTLENGVLSGAVKDDHIEFQPFQASVINGVLVFQWPNMDPGNPDCVNWDLPATATLNSDGSIMHVTASGIICSSTGGCQATVVGDLTKQETLLEKPSLQPIMSILLKETEYTKKQ
jgi:hypothetical protein